MAVRVPAVALALVLVGALAGCGRDPRHAAPGVGALVLHDGFDGDALAPTWGTCHWWATSGCTILTNDELQWYVPERVAVRGGSLHLTATPDPVVGEGRRFPYTSGMVSSGRPGDAPADRPRFAFTYGRVEVRFRVPRGAGTWPAIWLLPTTNEALPEIDLLEVHGSAPRRPSVTLHTSDGGRERRAVDTADLSEGWHTVRLDWHPGRLTWSIDGDEAMTVRDGVPDEPMYLVANLAVGGDAGRPADDALPATFVVDDVKVWSAA
jgi:beta-glucanase (GH16 family)